METKLEFPHVAYPPTTAALRLPGQLLAPEECFQPFSRLATASSSDALGLPTDTGMNQKNLPQHQSWVQTNVFRSGKFWASVIKLKIHRLDLAFRLWVHLEFDSTIFWCQVCLCKANHIEDLLVLCKFRHTTVDFY